MPPATIRLLLGIALALLAATSPLPITGAALAEPAVRGNDWSGWHVGGHFGYGFGANHIDITPMSPGAQIRAGFVSPRLDDSPTGFLGGLQLGASKQAGNIVYGFEADLSRTAIQDFVTGPFLIPGFNFQTTDGQRLDWLGTVRARVGFVHAARSLVFVTGGLAYGRAMLSTFAIDTSANTCGGTIKFCVSGHSEAWMAGWTLGGGVEHAFAPNWSAKIEYLRYDLGRITNSMVDILTPNPDVFEGSTRIAGNIVRMGVNYRFRGR